MFSTRCQLFYSAIAIGVVVALAVVHYHWKTMPDDFERRLSGMGIPPLPNEISLLHHGLRYSRPCSWREKMRERASLSLRKSQEVFLVSSAELSLSMLPGRNDKGEYYLLLSREDGHHCEPITTLFFPRKDIPSLFFFTNQGLPTFETNEWACALALSCKADCLVAWQGACLGTNNFPRPPGYRRFSLRGPKSSSGLLLIHERFD